jgi:hypothetical protein
MITVRTFKVDGLLPPGLVLNSRLSRKGGGPQVDTYVPLVAQPLGNDEFKLRYINVSQADGEIAYRLKGKITTPAMIGDARGQYQLAKWSSDVTVGKPVRLDLFHDPCVLLNAPAFSGVIEVLSGDDLPITRFSGQMPQSDAINVDDHNAQVGVVGLPVTVVMPHGYPETLVAVIADDVAAADARVNLAKLSDDVLSVYDSNDPDTPMTAITSAFVFYKKQIYNHELDHGLTRLKMTNSSGGHWDVYGLPTTTVEDTFEKPVFFIPNPTSSVRVLSPLGHKRVYDEIGGLNTVLLGWGDTAAPTAAVLAPPSEDMESTYQLP